MDSIKATYVISISVITRQF